MDSNDIYIEIDFNIYPPESGRDILLAVLSEQQFESFLETKTGLRAYIKQADWNHVDVQQSLSLMPSAFVVSHQINEIPIKNWNANWESSFHPILVGDYTIRTSFHPPKTTAYELIIEPKMSFGTGHHETTQLMMKCILELDISEFMVCDIGCGTGILSILAEMKGAKKIDAVDISKNCCNNTLSNIKLNNCDKIFVHNSNSKILHGKLYDLILSNMTYDKLSQNFKDFSTLINQGGELIISGFFENDLVSINDELIRYNFTLISSLSKNKWVAARFAYNKVS